MNSRPLRVLSLYDGFFVGGSRIVHTATVAGLHRSPEFNQEHRVISLTNKVQREYTVQHAVDTPSWSELQRAGVSIQALDRMPTSPWSATDFNQLREAIEWADVVFSLKEQPLVGLKALGEPLEKPLVVSLHRSDPENQGQGTADLLDFHSSGELTRLVSCAESARDSYVDIGLPRELIEVIHNGVDLDKFRPSNDGWSSLREALGIQSQSPVVAIVARFDEMKNIPLFMESAGKFLQLHPDSHFLAVGAGMSKENAAFGDLMERFIPLEHWPQIHGLGIYPDVPSVYRAADIVALTSAFGEAAPLCLLEAMACGAVPATTPVGDSALLVRKPQFTTNWDSSEIAQRWGELFDAKEVHRATIAEFREELGEVPMIRAFGRVLEGAARA